MKGGKDDAPGKDEEAPAGAEDKQPGGADEDEGDDGMEVDGDGRGDGDEPDQPPEDQGEDAPGGWCDPRVVLALHRWWQKPRQLHCSVYTGLDAMQERGACCQCQAAPAMPLTACHHTCAHGSPAHACNHTLDAPSC